MRLILGLGGGTGLPFVPSSLFFALAIRVWKLKSSPFPTGLSSHVGFIEVGFTTQNWSVFLRPGILGLVGRTTGVTDFWVCITVGTTGLRGTPPVSCL